MQEFTDTEVRLRPLVLDDVEELMSAGDEGSVHGGEDPDRVRERLRARIESAPDLENDGLLTLGVEHAGRLVGDVQVRAPLHGFPPGVCEFGIVLFAEARGRGNGHAAVTALKTYLFARGWDRVQASTSADNSAMRRLLERTGFEFEGVLRAFAPGNGRREDYALYAAIRDAGAEAGDGQVP